MNDARPKEPVPVPVHVGSVWFDDRDVWYVEHRSGGRKLRTATAPWSMFVDTSGLEPEEVHRIMDLIRANGGTARHVDGGYVRADVPGAKVGRRTRRRNVRDSIRTALRARYGADRVREADVDPVRRWIADHPEVTLAPDLRIAYLDLESGFPGHTIADMIAGRTPVLSYAVLGSDGVESSEVLMAGDPRTGDAIPGTERVAAETKMLTRMLRVLSRYDAVVAWYGGDIRPGRGFDFDVIRERCTVLGIVPGTAFSTPGSQPKVGIQWGTWIWLDQLEVYRKYSPDKESLGLGAVAARLEIAEGKLDFDASKVWSAWSSGPGGRDEILAYNRRDTALLPQIEEKTGYLRLHFQVGTLCGQIPHTRALQATSQADGFFFRFSGARGYHWPTCWWEDEPPEDDIEGAYVFETAPGLYSHVSIADCEALYPSIMRTWNIGPDTVARDPVDFGPGVPYCRAPNTDAFFRTDRDSHFRGALHDLIQNRAQYKRLLKDMTPGTTEYARTTALSEAAKIVANSFYGVLLCKWSRYYSAPAGLAVTSTGQWLIKHIANELEAATDPSNTCYNWKVVGGDTDSVFVHTHEDTIAPVGSDALFSEMGSALLDKIAEINNEWPERVRQLGCTESAINLEWEQSFARLALFRKKVYAGAAHFLKGSRPQTPHIHKYRGLAMRRGDRTALAKRCQRDVVLAILGQPTDTELPPVPSDDEITAIIDQWRDDVVDGELDLADVVVRQGLRKPVDEYRTGAAFTSTRCSVCKYVFPEKVDRDGPTLCPRCRTQRKRREPPAHVILAEELRDRGANPLPGDRIEYVYGFDPSGGWVPVLADEPGTKLDRAQYWYAAYSAAYAVLSITHPGVAWATPDKERTAVQRNARIQHNFDTAGTGGIFDIFSDPGSLFVGGEP